MPTVAHEGHRFHYEEQGSGAPLLLVHGTAIHAGALTGASTRLAVAHRVITFDRRGFLDSSHIPLPSTKEYLHRSAADVAGLLRELGAPRATVVGWGYGGVIALALAVDHPASVARVIVFDAPLHAKEHLGIRMTGAAASALGLGKVGLHRRGAQRFLRQLFRYEDKGSAFDELAPDVQKSMLATPRTVLAEMAAGGGEELSRGDLGTIRAPVGIVTGTRSARFLRQAVERTKVLIPAARVVRVSGGDHAMIFREPDRFVGAIRELLEP